MADLIVKPSRGIIGEITPPGDKSISHRAVMFAAVAEGATAISGFLAGEDTLNTAKAVRALGVVVEDRGGGALTVPEGIRVPVPLAWGGSSTARVLLRLCPESACQTGPSLELSCRLEAGGCAVRASPGRLGSLAQPQRRGTSP